jgi:hypothetical protein
MKASVKLVAAATLVLTLLLGTGCQGTVSVGAYVPGPYAGPYYGGPYGRPYGGGVYVGGTVPIW